MKIIYLANIRLPTEKAHGIQIMKMCEAFAREDCDVTLVVPRRFNWIKVDTFNYYQVSANFKIVRIPVIDTVHFGKIGFLFESLVFSCLSFFYVLFNTADVVYSRDEVVIFPISFIKKNIVWESHRGELNWAVRKLMSRALLIVVITNGLKQLFLKKDIPSKKICIAPDGVDLENFDITLTKQEARKRCGIPLDKKVVVYTGHLYEWKGVYFMAKGVSDLVSSVLTIFVGGTAKDIEKFSQHFGDIENIRIEGNKPHSLIPYYLRAADVAVIPNIPNSDISRLYTSPLKLFEYMASGTSIVASDLPSIREVLSENEALFFEAGDEQSFRKILEEALYSGDKGRAINARKMVEGYTWAARAKNILSQLQCLLEK